MISQNIAGKLFGIFFILTFFSYGIGSGLIESLINTPDFLTTVYANKIQLTIGAILMAVFHTVFNIGLPIVLFPILKPYNRYLTFGYFSAAISATLILVVGAIFLLLLIPLSDEFVKAGVENAAYFQTLGLILKNGNFFAYQIGMAIWGLGGLMFCSLLYKSNLVPRLLTLWGIVGYLIFISGTLLELFGHRIGVQLSIPGGLFEISLSLWLIFKGFRPSIVSD